MMRLGEVDLEIFELGPGDAEHERVLFLHDIDYLNGVAYPFVEALAEHWHILSPSHPGFGGSTLPPDFDSIDDLAYVYLDLLREIGPSCVLGAGFGGWIAAEMAVRCTAQMTSLVLVDALGIKVGNRTTADIADLFVESPQRVAALAWHEAERGAKEMALPVANGARSEDELTLLLSNRRTAALVGWNPFMHDPKLRRRLRRINRPTLVIWGASDRIVSKEYGQTIANSIPEARFVSIDAAGHYPYLENPSDFVQHVQAFLGAK